MIWLNRYIPVNTSVPCVGTPIHTSVPESKKKKKKKRKGQYKNFSHHMILHDDAQSELSVDASKVSRLYAILTKHLNYVDSEQGLPFHTVPTFQAQIGTVCLGEKPVRCSFSPRSLKILPTRRREACKRWIKIGKQCWISRFSLFFTLFFSFFFSLFFFSLG
ncbi:hypothetical protein B296_00002050 [Ensete ventricosum]|uniref:Uncharacterized protein n=1 Tax=Ensete ventricosum TaxID=4639 RepID=A0A427BCC6_ENSVE|nr:hypothetical protein B296_00002050 [Ensete ventricosum]